MQIRYPHDGCDPASTSACAGGSRVVRCVHDLIELTGLADQGTDQGVPWYGAPVEIVSVIPDTTPQGGGK